MINHSQQRILKLKLVSLWKPLSQWKLISLGRGFFDFQFSSTEDKRKAWSVGAWNLCLSKWSSGFNTVWQLQPYVQIGKNNRAGKNDPKHTKENPTVNEAWRNKQNIPTCEAPAVNHNGTHHDQNHEMQHEEHDQHEM
ncbi:hypothetical protein L195_g022671 [Trifolium pratense]|uniref:Uncharacterized protein n=1 Tax=Trifolium pratense TaxID=57577 RepID=A0A2K3N8P3_TRIPR|nr:hypothetical protein L195_g022671 [Trifolium pratense]